MALGRILGRITLKLSVENLRLWVHPVIRSSNYYKEQDHRHQQARTFDIPHSGMDAYTQTYTMISNTHMNEDNM